MCAHIALQTNCAIQSAFLAARIDTGAHLALLFTQEVTLHTFAHPTRLIQIKTPCRITFPTTLSITPNTSETLLLTKMTDPIQLKEPYPTLAQFRLVIPNIILLFIALNTFSLIVANLTTDEYIHAL